MKRSDRTKALSIWGGICSRADEVDPENRYVWEGIFVGVVIALGGTADYARELYRRVGFDMEAQ